MDIEVIVNGKTPVLTENAVIVCNNDGYRLKVEFDESWPDGAFVLMRYRVKGVLQARLASVFEGYAELPVIENTEALGIMFRDGDLDSEYIVIPCLPSVADDIGEETTPHDVYNALMGELHRLEG